MYVLITANRNYSSWSLRPWVLMASSSTALAAISARSKFLAFSCWSAKSRIDQATLPTRSYPMVCGVYSVPMISSVERPPMSSTRRRSSDCGSMCATPW